MDIQDYIAGLPVAVDGPTGRLGNHAVVHAGLQDHDARLAAMENSLRLDTTVGTRVFLGDIMIYGDTGRRSIIESRQDGWLGTPYIQRLGDVVYMSYDTSDYLRPDPDASVTNHPFLRLPVGFRAGSTGAQGLGYLNEGYPTSPNFVYGTSSLSTMRRGTQMYGILSWTTTDSWPTTLPGLPA